MSVWPNDHPPPHVHVYKAGRECLVKIGAPGEAPAVLYENRGMSGKDWQGAVALVQKYQNWRIQSGGIAVPTRNEKTEEWEYTKAEFAEQLARAEARKADRDARGEQEPVATAVRYDRVSRKFTLELANGTAFIFPADHCQGLRGAGDDDLAAVELTPGGFGLHWEALDADLGIAGLLTGFFGSKSWMDALRREMQAKGGRARSAAKTAAVRENGKKGGRPPKQAQA